MKPGLAFNQVSESSSSTPQQSTVTATGGISKEPRLRSALFVFGDGLFLILVSIVATALMHLVHRLGWNLALTLICGMAMAMVVQVLLAIAVAPLLGSIESMVPSMVVAMISPMAICSLDLLGFQLHWRESAQVGLAVGLIVFGLIEWYGLVCRRSLRKAYPCGGQW